jgi:hypothetical protein
MRIYAIGTIMPTRLGYDQLILVRGKSIPQGYVRGDFNFSRSVDLRQMMAIVWFDNKPVHFIGTGASAKKTTVTRRVSLGKRKHGAPELVSAPQIVQDYHKWMGGADVNNQLRLMRYAIQLSLRFRKYYKTLFFGLVDMAITNAFITHREAFRLMGKQPMRRADFMTLLQNQLLQVKAEDFDEVDELMSPAAKRRTRKKSASGQEHKILQTQDWYGPPEKQRRRQRACKVCALFRVEKSKVWLTTTWYCSDCTDDPEKRCYLCPRVRGHPLYPNSTCWSIWHDEFDSGINIPVTINNRVQMRRVRVTDAPRKLTPLELERKRSRDEDIESFYFEDQNPYNL